MKPTRVLVVGDIHLRDTPPVNCTPSYTDDLLEMLHWLADYSKKQDLDAVIWAGDVFDHKAPSKTSHALVMRLLEVVREHEGRLWIVPGNHDLCVTEDTEALTDQGWKFVNDLDGSERFATLNRDTGALEFHRPSSIHRLHYTGTGYHFKTESIDMVTTPNHGWWGAWRPGKALRRKTSAELFTGSIGWRLPAVRSWSGESPDTVKVGTFELPTDLAARLFGWYVAEGTADRSGSRVTISQSAAVNPGHYAEIVGILQAAEMPFSTQEKMIRINDRSVAEFFIEHFGYAGSKDMRLPRWLLSWDAPELQQFLFAYFRGDGTINGSVEARQIADYSRATVVARTANRGLADDLSEVGIRLGYRMRLSEQREFRIGSSEYVGHAYEQGFIKRASVVLNRPTVVELNEPVWCPSLPHETWLARRNGKTAWTGNSNDRLGSVHTTQPLGVLLAAGAHELIGWHETLPVYGVPWLQDWRSTLNRAFDSWSLDPWRFEDTSGDHAGTARKDCLAVMHAPIFPPELVASVPYENIPAESVALAMGRSGYLYYGHIHDYHGTFEVDGVTFANVGALSRGSLTESNLTRPVKAMLWSQDSGFTELDVPHRPAEEVFRVAEAAAVKAASLDLESFLAAVGSNKLDLVSAAATAQMIRELDAPDDVKDLAIELIEWADSPSTR